MLPNDINNRYHHSNDNQATSNLLDFLEPCQNNNSHTSSQLGNNSNAPNKSKQDPEEDLIKLVDNNHSSSQEKVPNKMKGIIDLVDNLYVNKKKNIADIQLKMIEEFVMTSKAPSKSVRPEQSAEFQSFFDRYEFDKKPNPVTANPRLGNTDLHLFEHKPLTNGEFYSTGVNIVDVKPNILHESLPSGYTRTLQTKDTENTVNEMQLSHSFNAKTIHNTDLQKKCSTSALISHINTEKKLPYSGAEELLIIPNEFAKTVKTANNSLTTEVHTNIFDEIVTRNRISYSASPVASSSNVIIDSGTEEVLKEPIKVPMTGIDKQNETCIKTKLDQKALTQELVSKYDIKYLEAVKKTDKTFKKSILKSDGEKLKLTRGPGLFEKTMVLPHIMHRVDQKNRALEEKNNVKMRLILEAGSSKTIQINDILLGGVNSSVQAPSAKNLNSVNNMAGKNSPLKTSISSFVNSFANAPVILKPPEVLLADCNKERLKALKSGKLLSNLVHKGDHFEPEYESP